MTPDKEHDSKDHSKNVNACISYAMRYTGRPAMAESRIISYSKSEDTVTWFYHDHENEEKHIVKDDTKTFIKGLLIHIPDVNFRTVRHYGFYSNKTGVQNKKDYSKVSQKKKRG